MPRNGAGVWSLPASYKATTGTKVQAEQHNDPLEDIQADLNAARPISAGGTGASTADAARTALGLDTMATQADDAVDINGGAIDGVTIGAATPAPATVVSMNGGQLAGHRNKVINGSFGVNQRGVSGTVVLAAGEYGHDLWKAGASGCTYTFATSENVTTINISAGSLVQIVEGINIQSGSHVLSWAGTVQMSIDGGTAAGSGVTATLTGGTNATIETSGTGTLSLVQLEPGAQVTPFEHRLYSAELAMCQRYYAEIQSTVRIRCVDAFQFCEVRVNWPVVMRASPSVEIGAALQELNIDEDGVLNVNATGGRHYIRSTIAGDAGAINRTIKVDAGL